MMAILHYRIPGTTGHKFRFKSKEEQKRLRFSAQLRSFKLPLSSLGIGSDSSSNTHSATPSSAPADPNTAGIRDTEGMEDIVAAEQVTTAAGD